MYRPTAKELKILLALKEVGEAEPMRLGSKIGMGSAMADYLCRYLTTHGLMQKWEEKIQASAGRAESP